MEGCDDQRIIALWDGRGAHYFPFVTPENPDRYRRKFDNARDEELRVIEELHYHNNNNSEYLSEIRAALVEQGMMDENEVTREIKLKASFKRTPLYKYGLIFTNPPTKKEYNDIFSFSDLGVTRKYFVHSIASGRGGASTVLNGHTPAAILSDETRRDIPHKEVERNIIQSAIARKPFYTFSSLRYYFPNLESISEFIVSDNYLGGLQITFQGNVSQLNENKPEKLQAVINLLDEIETQIRTLHTGEYEGTREFIPSRIHEIFKDKSLRLTKDNPRLE